MALYRKYRPSSFKEIIGQDHIVNVLKGSIDSGKISHAYLFFGTRGIGKTSIARIFASQIGTASDDLYEIDAASNRGIDDVRELKEGVSTLPFRSKYKVYIIDEVHMLTKEAFNALLKTLEEPPRHVVFILATTEMEKLPETVVSRCQVFQFKKPSQEVLKNVVISIAKKEGYTLEPSSAELIAVLGDRSFRDAQNILQKVLSFSKDKKISADEVELVSGAPKGELVNDFIEAIEVSDLERGLMAVRRANDANVDMRVFIKLVMHKIRLILLLKYAKDMEQLIKDEVTESDYSFLQKIAENPESKISSKTLLELLNAYDVAGYAHLPELPLELALISLISKHSD